MTRIVVERENVLKKNLVFIHHNISDISFYGVWTIFFQRELKEERGKNLC